MKELKLTPRENEFLELMLQGYTGLYLLSFIGLTFGLWKIIEVFIWIFKHISIVIH